MEQILWAVKAAPVADVNEWAVLVAMAEAADQDGTNSFLSVTTISNRTRLAERTVQRRMGTLEERGLIKRGDQSAARMIPADRRPVVYDVQVPLSFFRPEKTYDGEGELSVNIWRAGRGRAPLTAADRPELAPPPEKTNRTDKGTKRPRTDGVTTSHPVEEGESGGVTTSHPRGDYESPGGVTTSHPTLPTNPPHDPPRSAARSAATAPPVETSSSNVTSRNARAGAAAAQSSTGNNGGAARAGTPAELLAAMMLNPDEAERFRGWLVQATGATNPDGLIVTLHSSGRLSERLSQWRTAESTTAAPVAPVARAAHLQWCGGCDPVTRIGTYVDPATGREFSQRCPSCNVNAGQPGNRTGAVQSIAFEAAVAAAGDANGRGRAAFEAARAALPAGTPRRVTTFGETIDPTTARKRAESEQTA